MKVIKYFIIFFLSYTQIFSNPKKLPSYAEGKEILKKLIEESFNIKKEDIEIIEVPKNRIIRKIYKIYKYYYRYQISLPVYERNDRDVKIVSKRLEEIWLEIPSDFSFLQFTFLRIDLLPGENLVIME